MQLYQVNGTMLIFQEKFLEDLSLNKFTTSLRTPFLCLGVFCTIVSLSEEVWVYFCADRDRNLCSEVAAASRVLMWCTKIFVLLFLLSSTQHYQVVIRINDSLIQDIYSAKRMWTQQQPRAA